jgi:hypothetical protein
VTPPPAVWAPAVAGASDAETSSAKRTQRMRWGTCAKSLSPAGRRGELTGSRWSCAPANSLAG